MPASHRRHPDLAAALSAPAPTDTERPVRSITTGPRGYEGEGFPVVRAFAGVSAADLDPFVHMDQMGEVEYQPGEPRGTDWHPHRGFETVTYMIDGRFAHQDSHGGGGLITDGATQWMTAGSGILHIETPPAELVESGGMFHGIQLWVNLPRKDKFAHAALPGDRGQPGQAPVVRRRRRAGTRHRGRRRRPWSGPGATHTPITLAHATIEPGARLNLPWNRDFNALVYVLSGRGAVGPPGTRFSRVNSRCSAPATASPWPRTDAQDAEPGGSWRFCCWAASRFASRSFHYGPFVMNSKSELIQALEDYNAGRFGADPAGRADAAPGSAADRRGQLRAGSTAHRQCG